MPIKAPSTGSIDGVAMNNAERIWVGPSSDPAAVDAGASGSEQANEFHVREDLAGQVVEFDGDRFVIDFRRSP